MGIKILGISCFYHDSAACLIDDGEIVAAAQNERFTRVKHDPRFPLAAINYCLEQICSEESDIDYIAFYEKPRLVLDRIADTLLRIDERQAEKVICEIAPYWRDHKYHIRSAIESAMPEFSGEVLFSEHHRSHASSAFFPSPFSESAILTIDGVGEWATASICHGKEGHIKRLRELRFPNSVGLLYSAFTSFLGFKVNSGEYKVMGLAPYGKPIYTELILSKLVTLYDDGSIALNMDYFNFSGTGKMFTSKLEQLFGYKPRKGESRLTQFEMNLSASLQKVTEMVMLKMADYAQKLTGSSNLCLSGGVALNCVGNGHILRSKIFDNVWIQPASGDAGNALGAALSVWHGHLNKPRAIRGNNDQMKGSLLGPDYTAQEIRDFLELYGFPYQELDEADLPSRVSDMLERGEVIGLLQGRMEFGPRALGGRSIIGDPRDPAMQQRMNLKIKFRESFRPFAPIVLEEKAREWFELDSTSPYMLIVSPVVNEKRTECAPVPSDQDDLLNRLNVRRSQISAVTHLDYSARIQTVGQESAPRLKTILEVFERRTGVPILINTSFNLRGEPIVCSPMDAYRCMMRSNIDHILMENILVSRLQQPDWPEEADDWKENIPLD
jgi:carbamoyltransferase